METALPHHVEMQTLWRRIRSALTSWPIGLIGITASVGSLFQWFGFPDLGSVAAIFALLGVFLTGVHMGFVLANDGNPYRSWLQGLKKSWRRIKDSVLGVPVYCELLNLTTGESAEQTIRLRLNNTKVLPQNSDHIVISIIKVWGPYRITFSSGLKSGRDGQIEHYANTTHEHAEYKFNPNADPPIGELHMTIYPVAKPISWGRH